MAKARNLLESVVLLETVAEKRQDEAEEIVKSLELELDPEETAERLDIPEADVEAMLDREEPNPPHKRMEVSEESVERLRE